MSDTAVVTAWLAGVAVLATVALAWAGWMRETDPDKLRHWWVMEGGIYSFSVCGAIIVWPAAIVLAVAAAPYWAGRWAARRHSARDRSAEG